MFPTANRNPVSIKRSVYEELRQWCEMQSLLTGEPVRVGRQVDKIVGRWLKVRRAIEAREASK